jgi:hypothetical protein
MYMVDNHHSKSKSQRKNLNKPNRALDSLLVELLRRAERLHDALELYEGVVGAGGYVINDTHHRHRHNVTLAALELEDSLRLAGYDPITSTITIKDTEMRKALLAIAELMREIRLSRHASTKEQRKEVLDGFGWNGNGGWGFAEGIDKVMPSFANHVCRLEEVIVALREALGQTREPPELEPLVERIRAELDPAVPSLRRVGQIWELRYAHEERGYFPVNGNKILKQFALLLSKPNSQLTIGELLGDPDRKIKGDSLLGGVNLADQQTIRELRKGIDDLNDLIDKTKGYKGDTGPTEERKARLVLELKALEGKPKSGRKRSITGIMATSAGNAYKNILKQKNDFIREKLEEMPHLKAHLRDSVQHNPENYTFSYVPPAGSPAWFVDDPAA